jgi:hypothetical protein
VERWDRFPLTDVRWEELGPPIDLAFLFRSTPRGEVVALYPSPAGATEAPVDQRAWEDLEGEDPRLRTLEPDVEALLVNGIGPARECYRAPIDECFKLVGIVRTRWRGLSGGTEVRREIVRFFEALRARAVDRGVARA